MIEKNLSRHCQQLDRKQTCIGVAGTKQTRIVTTTRNENIVVLMFICPDTSFTSNVVYQSVS